MAEHIITPELRKKVYNMSAGGKQISFIAKRLHIPLDILLKYYSNELELGETRHYMRTNFGIDD